ncbi:MAG TPA: hypothetical protein VNM92_16375 [Thermoanaerobaculia bacterium]|nr:hypothetical protein [Thermoanaerobaculia bacterium]
MRRPKDHILIIEPDAQMRTQLVSLFLQAAFRVDTAREADEAIEKLTNSQFAAIVINREMIRDSSRALDFLREEQPELVPRVIVVSRDPLTAAPDGRDSETFLLRIYDITEPERMVQAVRDCASRPMWC